MSKLYERVLVPGDDAMRQISTGLAQHIPGLPLGLGHLLPLSEKSANFWTKWCKTS